MASRSAIAAQPETAEAASEPCRKKTKMRMVEQRGEEEQEEEEEERRWNHH